MVLLIGTGKTLLARAVAKQLDANFLKVVSSAIVDKYIGESARLIREMFGKCVKGGDCNLRRKHVQMTCTCMCTYIIIFTYSVHAQLLIPT